MDETAKTAGGQEIRQLTDQELEEILKKSEGKTDFPPVSFDEFTPPSYDEWVDVCCALLKGRPFDKVMYTRTYEGITFSPIYTWKTGPDAQEKILPRDEYPGMGNFLRGQTACGYEKHPWGIAQVCDETLPADSNELLKHEIDRGSTVYHVRVDSATLDGVDVTDAEKPGDTGVSLTTLEDMHTLLSGLDLAHIPFMMYAGVSPLALLALTAAAVRAQGGDIRALEGVIGANPLAELAAHGRNRMPLEKSYEEMAACIRWTRKHAPELRTVMVSSDVFSLGGAQAVQETAYTFGMAVEYIREMQKRGLSIHDIARSLYFGFNIGANFYIEIARLRAARVVWAQIMEAFGADEEDRAMKIHARPAFFTKTIFDAGVNMLRNTTEAFSAVVGGVDTYENSPYDDTVRKGDEFSRRIARNLQIMLQEEFGMLRPIDPAGGSWAIEALTKEMAEKIWQEFQCIEGRGGMTKALMEGYPQKEIARVLAERFRNLDLRRDSAVGNNMYPNIAEELIRPRPEDTEALRKQLAESMQAYRKDQDMTERVSALHELRQAKEDGLVDSAVRAFSAGATLGEVSEITGTGEDSLSVEAIAPHRWTERYEALRFDTEAYKEKTGQNVEVFLANMGRIPQHKARADFSTSFLQVGEFNVHLNEGFQDDETMSGIDKCAKAAAEFPYDAAVICSTDATYPDIVPELAPKLKAALPEAAVLFLAGAAPKELEEIYRAAGVDEFISVRANCYEILRMLQKKKGMIE